MKQLPYLTDNYMSVTYNINCDGCGATLDGMVDNKKIRKEYLSIKQAKVSMQLKDEFIFITRPPMGDLAFCMQEGMPCIQQCLDRNRASYNHHKRQKLSQEAEVESSFTVGTKR